MSFSDMTIYPTCETCGGRAKVPGALNAGTCDCPQAPDEEAADFAEQLAAAREEGRIEAHRQGLAEGDAAGYARGIADQIDQMRGENAHHVAVRAMDRARAEGRQEGWREALAWLQDQQREAQALAGDAAERLARLGQTADDAAALVRRMRLVMGESAKGAG